MPPQKKRMTAGGQPSFSFFSDDGESVYPVLFGEFQDLVLQHGLVSEDA